MSKYLERAQALRAITTTHYNCSQTVLLAFAPEFGLSDEMALRIASNFGSGMKIANVCGAITGGLMVLGLYGVEDSKSVAEYFRRLKEHHEEKILCADLLRKNKELGKPKKEHCDGMVYECITLVETMLRERGILAE